MRKNNKVKPAIVLGLFFVSVMASFILPNPAWAPPDSDGDSVINKNDLCPDTPPGVAVDATGCPLPDTDGDGIADIDDSCPNDPYGTNGDPLTGCPDSDGDGFYAIVEDCVDNNASINPGALEVCGNGVDENCNPADDECGGILDADGDGLSDTLEQTGVVLRSDLTLVSRDPSPSSPLTPATAACQDGTTGTCYFLPPCSSNLTADDPARGLCVDWQSEDIFVIAERASGCSDPGCAPLYDINGDGVAESNMPLGSLHSSASSPAYYDPFATIAAVQSTRNEGGLGIAVHELLQDTGVSTDQFIADEAYAVRLVESLATDAGRLGLHTLGSPILNSQVTIWTERIKRWLFWNCTEISLNGTPTGIEECRDSVKGDVVATPPYLIGVSPTNQLYRDYQLDYYAIIRNYTQDIISHELGHAVDLATGDQIHYPAADGVVMEQTIGVDATKKKNDQYAKVALYISSGYHDDDKQNFDLK